MKLAVLIAACGVSISLAADARAGGQDDGQDIDENTHQEAQALGPPGRDYYRGSRPKEES